ncbi:MAG TPA: HPP family protein [Flavobacterium sp.]|jgi:CBS-domain-containing membrane protein
MPIKKIKRTYRKTRYVLYRETLVDFREHFWAFTGSAVGIGLIAFLQSMTLPVSDVVYLIGSFGASAVLVYGVIHSPLAQPRNLIGGHVISAFIGVSVQTFVPDFIWLTAPLAVSLSIIAMQMTKTLHPPGGATALIAVTGSAEIKALGYWYVLSPVLSGAIILLICALIFNNISSKRSYPSGRPHYGLKKRLKSALRR